MRAVPLVVVSAAALVSGVFFWSPSASAALPTPGTTPQATGTPAPGTTAEPPASPTAQPTSPIDFGPTVPGGPASFVPTIAAEPSLLKIVLVDYALALTPLDYRAPVMLIAHDEGTACQYRIELSPDQARTLFTTGELELTLPARCRLVELAFRQLVMTPTMDCPSGEALCKREEIIEHTIFLPLEGSEYRSGSFRELPSGPYALPATGGNAPRGDAGGYAWITLTGFAAVSLGVIGLRVRKR